MLVKIVGGLRRGRGLDSPHEPVHDQDATKARPERDLAFSGHFLQVSPERSGACADDVLAAGSALHAFFQKQYCGDLDGGVEGDRVWMTCTCRAVIVRPLEN